MSTVIAGLAAPSSAASKRLVLIVLYLAAGVAAVTITSNTFYALWNDAGGKAVAAMAIIGMPALPIVMSMVHAIYRDRQLNKLDTLAGFPVANSYYFRAAQASISKMRVIGIDTGYIVPTSVLLVLIFALAALLFSSPWFMHLFQQKHFLLGGSAVLDMMQLQQVALYQQGTFLCAMMAFIGSYLYMLGRLWERINNNDVYPISYHYFTIRFVIALCVAIVFRHSLAAFGVIESPMIVLFGFVIGLTPDLFILAMARKAYQAIKVHGGKPDPAAANRPPGMPLMMLDDLTRDKIDRLGELGIDSAQALACQNPLLVWPRLPYDLGLIVDWIAQAQLYLLVREQGLGRVRALCVYDIFDLHLRLSDADARGELCRALGIAEPTAPVIVRQLDDDHSFTRLREVRAALRA